MTAANDSTRFVQTALENDFAVPPPYVITIAGTPSGTFTLTVNGETTSAISATANATTVRNALTALTILGANPTAPTCSGALSSGMTVVLPDDFAIYPVSASFASTVATTKTLTGGPQWTVLKIEKFGHTPKLNIELAETERNARDKRYADSVAAGGASEEWAITTKAYADQAGIYWAMAGFDDTVTQPDAGGNPTVYYHTLKPGSGNTYSVRAYDGLKCWCSRGVGITDLGSKGSGGETTTYDYDIKGWGLLASAIDPPTITLPSNTSYVMMKPTNTGVRVTLNSAVTSLLNEWNVKWQAASKPLYTHIGSRHPYRPEYGARGADIDVKLVFDDATEMLHAVAAPPASRNLIFLVYGIQDIGTTPLLFSDAIFYTIPAWFYTDPKVTTDGDAPMFEATGKTVYDTSNAAQLVVVIHNNTATAY